MLDLNKSVLGKNKTVKTTKNISNKRYDSKKKNNVKNRLNKSFDFFSQLKTQDVKYNKVRIRRLGESQNGVRRVRTGKADFRTVTEGK